MSEWQPIETAPKDGTEIIVWFDGSAGGMPVIVRYSRRRPDKFKWTTWGADALSEDCVRLWQPTPEPPK